MATITVTSNANQGSGSLREAISIAKDGDTIKFAKNLAQKTITLTTGQLILGKSITLDGQNVPGLTINFAFCNPEVFYCDIDILLKLRIMFQN